MLGCFGDLKNEIWTKMLICISYEDVNTIKTYKRFLLSFVNVGTPKSVNFVSEEKEKNTKVTKTGFFLSRVGAQISFRKDPLSKNGR